jgi:DMSO/TMAO reductase YedYZ molybdopterin-dependent catalytic subunit
VKWLRSVTVLDEPFTGFQNAVAYRFRGADGSDEPVTRIRPRALLVPPGFPDFMSRTRVVDAGPHVVAGRAWSGWAPIASVAVSTDGGETWLDARLDPPDGPYAWRRWTFGWTPQREGRVELCCRAVDDLGNRQPDAPRWNVGGYGNNAVQRVAVDVIA